MAKVVISTLQGEQAELEFSRNITAHFNEQDTEFIAEKVVARLENSFNPNTDFTVEQVSNE